MKTQKPSCKYVNIYLKKFNKTKSIFKFSFLSQNLFMSFYHLLKNYCFDHIIILIDCVKLIEIRYFLSFIYCLGGMYVYRRHVKAE